MPTYVVYGTLFSALLKTTAKFMREATAPRTWLQPDLSAPAHCCDTSAADGVPLHQSHLMDQELHGLLADGLPGEVSAALQAKVLQPCAMWLQAFDSAKVRELLRLTGATA